MNDLMSSLASTIRAASALPLNDCGSSDCDGATSIGGDFDFQYSFPEFKASVDSSRVEVNGLIKAYLAVDDEFDDDGGELSDDGDGDGGKAQWDAICDRVDDFVVIVDKINEGTMFIDGDGTAKQKVRATLISKAALAIFHILTAFTQRNATQRRILGLPLIACCPRP